MKKETLKISNLNSSEEKIFFSISSSESELKICWIINQALNINLSLSEDLIVHIKSSPVSFKRYFFESEEGIEKYFLFVNRNQGYYLFPELKKVDYLFLVLSDCSIKNIEASVQNLKKNPAFSALLAVDPSMIRSFKRLGF